MPASVRLQSGRHRQLGEGLRTASPHPATGGRPALRSSVRPWLTFCFTATATVAGAILSSNSRGADDARPGGEPPTIQVQAGELAATFRDNSESPRLLSGVDRLVHVTEAPDFDAFDPHDPGSSAGLNFEHIISGHSNPANWFAPRHGLYRLQRGTEPNSVVLVRRAADDPWALESRMTYTVAAPHAIDFEFRCEPKDARRFGRRQYGVLFWADYMNDVEEVALHFRGVNGPDGPEQWIAASAPPGHPDYVGGGTYRHVSAAPLEYDSDHNLKLNLWSYDYPRFSVPFYYGLAAHGMVLILMFDRGWSAEDEIRFSLFKFKVGEQVRRPAWDFQYVIHRVETGRQYGYRGRLVWKKFVSPEDCQAEYTNWIQSLSPGGRGKATATAPAAARSVAAAPSDSSPTVPNGWRLPPRGRVTRTAPRLVNYFHMALPDGQADYQEERLAQWNVVILNHDLVTGERLSLARMRRINPRIKLLAWVPLQGPNTGLAKGVPPKGDGDWYARTADGTYLTPHWGGHLMSATAQGYAWPKHVLTYIRRHCLRPGAYDGLMLDCLWRTEPGGHDANSDGVHDARDTAAWQAGMLFLLRQLRAEFPEAILVGNGGVPWPADCPYYEFANGCMHENALGDQFGGVEWRSLWDAYRTALSRVSGRPAYHFIQADVRADGRSQADAAGLRRLTEEDHRRLRLGLATTLLLDGGYFGFDRGDCLHGQLWWFDEYDVELGAPLGGYVEGRYGPGTFARDFERGSVVVNPTATPIVLPDPTRAAGGSEGTGAATIVVPPGDARILQWAGASAPRR